MSNKDSTTIRFILVICTSCALLISLFSFFLAPQQQRAKRIDQNKQLLIAARLLSPEGYFLIHQSQTTLPAIWNQEQKLLIPSSIHLASAADIEAVMQQFVRPLVLNHEGTIASLEQANINLNSYLSEHHKEGFAHLPWKLFYAILPNHKEALTTTTQDTVTQLHNIAMVVVPIAGQGLWSPIYGYLAIDRDGMTVIGTTWYEQQETPGLGANIATTAWQKQFEGKSIFQHTPTTTVNPHTTAIGITVVKGKVQDIYKDNRALNCVDGMSGATLTGQGVTQAYRTSLSAYRALFIQLQGAS